MRGIIVYGDYFYARNCNMESASAYLLVAASAAVSNCLTDWPAAE